MGSLKGSSFRGGQAAEVIEVRDEQTVCHYTTESSGVGCFKAESPDDPAVLPQAFEYFDPSAASVAFGEPIVRAVNVTTMDAMSGERIDGATIVVDMLGTDLRWSGLTDERGLLTLSIPLLCLRQSRPLKKATRPRRLSGSQQRMSPF